MNSLQSAVVTGLIAAGLTTVAWADSRNMITQNLL